MRLEDIAEKWHTRRACDKFIPSHVGNTCAYCYRLEASHDIKYLLSLILGDLISGESAHRKLNRILALLSTLTQQEISMNADTQAAIADLAKAAAEDKDLVRSAITVMNGLSAQIAALATKTEDPAIKQQILDLAASVKAANADLANGIVANTPAA